MAKTELLQADYSRAVVKDVPRHELPRNASWLLRDYIPNLGGIALRKRGGWPYASPALSNNAEAVSYVGFPAADQLVAVVSNGHVYKVDSVGSATDKGAAAVPAQAPIYFNDKLIIPGSAAAYTYDGAAAPGALTGAPANCPYGTAYKSRLVLAGNRTAYFSDPLDATGWDTTNTWIPLTEPVKGVAALRNSLLFFGSSGSERVRGDIPPPGGDMVREPLFEEGCIDARSIVVRGDKVLWANANGVHITDGAGIDNLVELGGIQQYWTALFDPYDASTWLVAAGTWAGLYVVSVTNGSGHIDALACDVSRKTWLFLNNFPATMFASAHNASPETYFAVRGAARLGKMSDLFDPTSANKSDGNGTDVQPTIETAYFRGKPGSQRWRNLRVGAHLDAPAGTYLKVSYVTDPSDTTYTVLTEPDGTTPLKINPNSSLERVKLTAGLASNGIGLKIEQVGPSNDTKLFDLEAEVREREGVR